MPNTCSAPGYRSNYSGEPYTPVFRLPSNSELREKWLRALHREDIEDLKNVFVCSNHFRTEDVTTEMDMPKPDGSLQKISRRPILHKNAIPCLLPSCPKYLSSPSPKPERLDRGKIESKLFFQALEQSLDLHKAEDNKFGVKSLGELKCKLEELELPSWVKWFSDDTSINLLKLSKDKHIYIQAYVSINDSLTPTGFCQNIQIPLIIHNLSDIRGIDTIISEVSAYTKDPVENIESTISKIAKFCKVRD